MFSAHSKTKAGVFKFVFQSKTPFSCRIRVHSWPNRGKIAPFSNSSSGPKCRFFSVHLPSESLALVLSGKAQNKNLNKRVCGLDKNTWVLSLTTSRTPLFLTTQRVANYRINCFCFHVVPICFFNLLSIEILLRASSYLAIMVAV